MSVLRAFFQLLLSASARIVMITAMLLGCRGEYSSPTAPPPPVVSPPHTTTSPPPPPPGIVTYQSSSFWQITALSATEPAISYECPGRLTITYGNGSSFLGTMVMDSADVRCQNRTYLIANGRILSDGSIQFDPVDDDYAGIADIFTSPNGPYCKLIAGDQLLRGFVVAGTLDARGQLTVDCPIVGRRDLTVRVTGTR